MKKEEAKEELAVNGDVKEEVKGAEAAAVEAGDEPKVHASAKGCNSSPDDDKVAPTMKEEQEHAPNSTPRMMDPDEDTYVYRDFSAVPPPTMSEVGSLHPQSLQAQKLPAKLASMLADHGKFYTQIASNIRKDLTDHSQPLFRACLADTATQTLSLVHSQQN